jgi:DNA replication and repair protein RecF
LNVIYGNNGSGKSNLIEAIFYVLQGNGFRTKKDMYLLKHNASFLRTEAKFTSQSIEKTVSVAWEKEAGKRITINGRENEKVASLFEECNVIIMTPATPELVKGGPEHRRKFIDRIHAKENPAYLAILNRYSITFRTRNLLLKRRLSNPHDKDMYRTLTHNIRNLSKIIQSERKNTVNQMQEVFFKICEQLNLPSLKNIKIMYSPSSIEIIDEYLLMQKEIQRGASLIGSHLDRLSLKRDSRSLRIYGSEGEQKITAFVLKLCEFYFLETRTKNVPIVMLDDFQSELDSDNFKKMLAFIRPKAQIFLTSLNHEVVENPDKVFRVENEEVNVKS